MAITPFIPKDDIKPYLVAALDIETASSGDVLGIGFAWEDSEDNRRYKAFDTWDSWYDFFVKEYRKSDTETRFRLRYIYAHNGAAFDWLSLVLWAEEKGIMQKLEFILSGGMGIGIDLAFPKFTVHLRDSVRLMPGTLKTLCESFKTEHGKLEVPSDYITHMEDFKRDHNTAFWAYLQNDVFGLQEAVRGFWQVIYDKVGSIDRLPMTLPALAMKLWRMTLKREIHTTWNSDVKALERRAYTGGRTECYAIGTFDVKVYDINSLYPSQMATQLFPSSYKGYWVEDYRGNDGIYELTYKQTNRERKAVLRDETTQEFKYEGSGVYTHPEIAKLLAIGGEISVSIGYEYATMEPLFADFINDWYSTRKTAIKNGDTGLGYVCKILMNSLYGKFGQSDVGEKLVFWDADKMFAELEKGTKFTVKGEFCIVEEQRNSETTFVAIAAYITAYARLADYKAMEDAENMGMFVTYTDTDSQHVVGGDLPTGLELGELKEEYAGSITYLAKKLYARNDGKITAKGIGKDARAKMTPELFVELAESGRDYTAEFTTFPSIKETMFKQRKANRAFTRSRTIRASGPLTPQPKRPIMEGD